MDAGVVALTLIGVFAIGYVLLSVIAAFLEGINFH